LGRKITKNKMFKKLVFSLFITLSTIAVQAQDDIDALLRAGTDDANALIGAYIDPFMKGFGTALGNGWANTAKAHKSLGFDITLTANAAYIPDEDLLFNVNDLNLQNTTLVSSEVGGERAPTLFGPESRSVYEFTDPNSGESIQFDGVEGLDIKENAGIQAVPIPMLQLGIGIVKNTDLKVRWTPTINIGDEGEFKMLGFALMHDIKQHIPGIKLAPFDLSVLVGFTDVSISADLSEETAGGPGTPGEVTTPNGEAVFDVNTWTVQGLISKKLSVFTFYGGVGYNFVNSELAMNGDYQIRDDFGLVEETITDPININVNESGPRLTAGMRLKLAIITLHADYTLQKYNTLTVGFGFSVR